MYKPTYITQKHVVKYVELENCHLYFTWYYFLCQQVFCGFVERKLITEFKWVYKNDIIIPVFTERVKYNTPGR